MQTSIRNFTHLKRIASHPPTINQHSYFTRRNDDGALFLSRGFPIPKDGSGARTPDEPLPAGDKSGHDSALGKLQDSLPYAETQLLRILNHPNLVNLVSIVQPQEHVDFSDGMVAQIGYAVLEDCNAGNLSAFIKTKKQLAAWIAKKNPQNTAIVLGLEQGNEFGGHDELTAFGGSGKWPGLVPESLCWHILNAISKALLWLHKGIKLSTNDGRNEWLEHDKDWQPILIRKIAPDNIFFCGTKDNTEFGACKLGDFGKAKVTFATGMSVLRPSDSDLELGEDQYWAPEIAYNLQRWRASSEIWMLGSVIFELMTGTPAPRNMTTNNVQGEMLRSDRKYSSQLVGVLTQMLEYDSNKRIDAAHLTIVVAECMGKWRTESPESEPFHDPEAGSPEVTGWELLRGI